MRIIESNHFTNTRFLHVKEKIIINRNVKFTKIVWIANEKLVILKTYLSHSTSILTFNAL